MTQETPLEFLALGDVLTDAFIELQDASVHCDIDHENCTLSMRFGDKIPYRHAAILRGVGNAANAAVAAKRLGLSSALMATVGDDEEGVKTLEHLHKEQIDTDFMRTEQGIPTNYHYVLRYGAERTILVKHEAYTYPLPQELLEKKNPQWIYFTSIAKESLSFHHELMSWLNLHPEIQLAFQPGTFQLQLGKEELRDVYARTNAFFCNKEEARKILDLPHAHFYELHAGIRALGPQRVIITDGPGGMTASENNDTVYFLPMYPDPQVPVDRTGAGDACSSTITAALHMGLPLQEAMMWGPINSMSVVQYIGAQEGLLSRKQLEEYLAHAPEEYRVTILPRD